MTHADIPLGMQLKALAGWNQTADDWRLLLDAGVGWVAAYDGIDAGTATVMPYAGDFSWIGMVLVDPAYRRRGIGTTLLHATIAESLAHGGARLDATPQGVPLYTRLGFRAEDTISRMVRLPGLFTGPPEVGPPDDAFRPVTPDRFERIVRLDVAAFGADRRVVLETLWRRSPQYALCSLDGQVVRGYCLGRTGTRYEQIGPVVATSTEVAVALVTAMLSSCADRPLIVDVLDRQVDWVNALSSLGFRGQRSFTRMTYGKTSTLGVPRLQYAIAGPEYG